MKPSIVAIILAVLFSGCSSTWIGPDSMANQDADPNLNQGADQDWNQDTDPMWNGDTDPMDWWGWSYEMKGIIILHRFKAIIMVIIIDY